MTTVFTLEVTIGKHLPFKRVITINSFKPTEQDLYNAIDKVAQEFSLIYPAGTRISVVPVKTQYVFQIKQK